MTIEEATVLMQMLERVHLRIEAAGDLPTERLAQTMLGGCKEYVEKGPDGGFSVASLVQLAAVALHLARDTVIEARPWAKGEPS